MKKFHNRTASLLLIASIILFCSCSRNMESKEGSDNTANDNIVKELSLSKDLGLDSVVIFCDVNMWCSEFRFLMKDSVTMLFGRVYFEKWKSPIELSEKDRNQLIDYINGFFVSKDYDIIARKHKTNEFIEGEFTDIDVILYRDGKKNKNHISTRPTTLDGYSIEFSKEFQDFRHMLHELALEYRKLVIDHGD